MEADSTPICLLDDDLPVLKANSRLLVSAGWDVQGFRDPAAFLEYARTNKPALAVIDMMMPEMDGLEVQSMLREVSPTTRVIILTSNDDPEIETAAVEAGVFAFFFKPADPDKFLVSVESAIKSESHSIS